MSSKGLLRMAYPKPILPIKGKAAKEFAARLESFKLTQRQKNLYRGAKKAYENSRNRESR